MYAIIIVANKLNLFLDLNQETMNRKVDMLGLPWWSIGFKISPFSAGDVSSILVGG